MRSFLNPTIEVVTFRLRGQNCQMSAWLNIHDNFTSKAGPGAFLDASGIHHEIDWRRGIPVYIALVGMARCHCAYLLLGNSLVIIEPTHSVMYGLMWADHPLY